MANINCKIKRGMKGSDNGRSRWDYTETLKAQSKKSRRQEGKLEIEEHRKEKVNGSKLWNLGRCV